MAGHQYDEGHTVAGWTGVAIATAGTAVTGAGVCAVSPALLAGGGAVVVLSALVTWALHLTGWGKPPGVRPRAEWGMRVRDTSALDGHPECVGCRLAGRKASGRKVSERNVTGRKAAGRSVLSEVGASVVGDGTGMEVRGAAVGD
ncbi:HGxxPAAW family protein [Streptomyces sp. NPDC005811]|uniref:HGxxPAAW family protein n=1 Tax=Streptomyces sp. NPDC005811 TaxID=3154565 RepID=UPI0033EC566E